jgi:hypothetical protein
MILKTVINIRLSSQKKLSVALVVENSTSNRFLSFSFLFFLKPENFP